jgi:hypothetical protein
MAIDPLVAGGRLHPRVGHEDPGDRQHRAETHHAGGEHHHPLADPPVPVDEQAEEAGLE